MSLLLQHTFLYRCLVQIKYFCEKDIHSFWKRPTTEQKFYLHQHSSPPCNVTFLVLLRCCGRLETGWNLYCDYKGSPLCIRQYSDLTVDSSDVFYNSWKWYFTDLENFIFSIPAALNSTTTSQCFVWQLSPKVFVIICTAVNALKQQNWWIVHVYVNSAHESRRKF